MPEKPAWLRRSFAGGGLGTPPDWYTSGQESALGTLGGLGASPFVAPGYEPLRNLYGSAMQDYMLRPEESTFQNQRLAQTFQGIGQLQNRARAPFAENPFLYGDRTPAFIESQMRNIDLQTSGMQSGALMQSLIESDRARQAMIPYAMQAENEAARRQEAAAGRQLQALTGVLGYQPLITGEEQYVQPRPNEWLGLAGQLGGAFLGTEAAQTGLEKAWDWMTGAPNVPGGGGGAVSQLGTIPRLGTAATALTPEALGLIGGAGVGLAGGLTGMGVGVGAAGIPSIGTLGMGLGAGGAEAFGAGAGAGAAAGAGGGGIMGGLSWLAAHPVGWAVAGGLGAFFGLRKLFESNHGIADKMVPTQQATDRTITEALDNFWQDYSNGQINSPEQVQAFLNLLEGVKQDYFKFTYGFKGDSPVKSRATIGGLIDQIISDTKRDLGPYFDLGGEEGNPYLQAPAEEPFYDTQPYDSGYYGE